MKQLSAFTFLLFALASFGSASPPNIILMMGDDHGWSETGYNGHPYVKTPVLDEMAETGLRLDRFYAGHPTCSPTRGSFLTGRHPNRYGIFTPGYSIRPEEVTFAHLLGKAGYRCGHFGKWHIGPVKKESPTNPGQMGFHEYVSHDNFYEMDPVMSRNGGPPEKFPGEGAEVTMKEAMDFMGRTKKDGKPFLAVVWFGSPHEPYSGLPKDLALYDNLPDELSQKKVRLTSNETGRPTERPLRDVLRERYAEITAMDRSIGQLREFLDKEGIRDNTLVWYCGDNGNPRSSGRTATSLRAEKGHVYEGGIRVPGVLEWPAKIRKGRVSNVNTVTSDFLPTLCSLAGVSLPCRPLDGVDLVPLLHGEMESRPKPIGFWGFDTRQLMKRNPKPYIDAELQKGTTPLVKFMGNIRTRNFKNFHHPGIQESDFGGARVLMDNRYKLVVDGSKGAGVELFDVVADLAEEKNLAQSKPEITARMQKQLREWQESVLKSLVGEDYQ